MSPSGNKFMRTLGTNKSLLYNCMATTCYIYQLCVVFPKSSLFLMQNHQILTIARWNVRYHVRIFSIIHISEFHVWSPLSIFSFHERQPFAFLLDIMIQLERILNDDNSIIDFDTYSWSFNCLPQWWYKLFNYFL